ncbi:MAG: hypothetical protein U0586_10170 [Candidatus Brocadiaceae bacterium]
MKEFPVFKETGTYADSLRAVGTASLLEEISGMQTTIRDMGTHFQVECPKDVSSEELKPPLPGFYYILKKSKEKDKPSGLLILDYEEEKSRADGQKKGAAKRKKAIDTALEEQSLATIEKPHREYRPAAILESMRKGWSSDKDVYHWVVKNPAEALKWVQNELELFGPLERFEPLQVSNSQFYNPASGKGVHAAKTIAKSPGAISNEVVQPFAEWMKYRGAYIAMLPYRNGDDFKLFVIEPAEIGPKALALLREKLLDLNLWGGIRLDIEASLRLAEELIMHSDVMGQTIGLRRKRPAEVVKGLRQTYFKSMGTAAALMNDAFLPLPSWFCIENSDDANAFLGIIREHIGDYARKIPGCLWSLNETHSGDVPILQQYRKWLTTGDLSDLLNFLARFAVHVMEKLAKKDEKERVKEFSTENLSILFERRYRMKEIVENQGFKNITDAIRNSTVSSFENPKSGWKGSGYETLFGMAQEWKQKIKGGAKAFVPVLSEFVQKHNWEAVHKLKKGSPPISQDDLNNVVILIDQFGVELVGMLLLAYGYARAPKT